MSDRLNQDEFDDLDAHMVHLLIEGTNKTLCSGQEIDPTRWQGDTLTPRKQCQACRLASIKSS